MGKTLDNVYKHQSLAYKYFLYVVSVALIVFFFPKGGKFKYEFQKGKPWQYENLYAPIDFSIKKSQEEIAEEQQSIRNGKTDYYTFDATVVADAREEIDKGLTALFQSDSYTSQQRRTLSRWTQDILDEVYGMGIFSTLPESKSVVVVKNNEALPMAPSNHLDVDGARQMATESFSSLGMTGAFTESGVV